MSELTQIDGTFQNIAMGGDKRDWDPNASRWTKGDNDRLYFNDCKYVDYVDLESMFVHTDAPNTTATAEIAGDTLTVEIVFKDDIANKEKEMSATFQLPSDLAEESHEDDDDSTDDEPKLVSDGGEDITAHVDDETIEAAIESNDDPDHPDAYTVDQVREMLATIQRSAEEGWEVHMDNVENGDAHVVYEDADTIVLSTGEYNTVAEELRHAHDGELDDEGIAHSIVTQIHHELANYRVNRSWGVDYPYVIVKPDSFDAGQRFVEAVVNSLQLQGCSPGQAWAYYGVEIRGESRNRWGKRKGDHDHKNVSDALEKARSKITV